MKHSIIKDRHFRLLSSFYERRRVVFRSIIENKQFEPRTRTVLYEVLSSFPSQTYSTRSRNRCTLTSRSRAIYRKFGRSRLRFRKLASHGVLVGVKKASWLFLKMNHVCDRISRLRIASANNAPSFERKLGFINQEKGSNFFLFQILSLLKREGYIRFFNIYTHKRFLHVTIYLKYNLQGSAPFQSIFPVSTPGRSIFISANSLWQPLSSTGLFVVSTSKGLLTDSEARRLSLGGLIILGIL